jgi:Ca2+-binding RTX toxin-like protein
MRRIVLLLSSIAAALLLVSGVALADHLNTVQCPNNPYDPLNCSGTQQGDHIYGTDESEFIDVDISDDAPGEQVDANGGDDEIYGGWGNDVIYGGKGADFAWADIGADKLYGGSGLDTLEGADGQDFVHGGPEKDVLDGNPGADQIQGGDGSDTIHTGFKRYRDGSREVDGAIDTVDCGSGTDKVYFEKGVDKVNANCEQKVAYRAGWHTP